MNRKNLVNTVIASSLLLSSALGFAGDDLNVFRVTVTNLTANHIIIPPAVVAHKHSYPAFRIGMPSPEGLAT